MWELGHFSLHCTEEQVMWNAPIGSPYQCTTQWQFTYACLPCTQRLLPWAAIKHHKMCQGWQITVENMLTLLRMFLLNHVITTWFLECMKWQTRDCIYLLKSSSVKQSAISGRNGCFRKTIRNMCQPFFLARSYWAFVQQIKLRFVLFCGWWEEEGPFGYVI